MTAQHAHFRRGGLSFEGKQEGVAIPPGLRRALEKVLRFDLSTVCLRTNPDLEDLGALACMQGENVYLSPSAPPLSTPAGVAVLGHELAHVLQQRAGRVIAQAAARPAGPKLADLAAECSYYDQAHLAREFRQLAGCPPSQWLAEEFRFVQAGPADLGE